MSLKRKELNSSVFFSNNSINTWNIFSEMHGHIQKFKKTGELEEEEEEENKNETL